MSVKTEADTVRDLISELHGVIKDAKQAKREVEEVWRSIRADIDAKIEAEVASCLEDLTDQINVSIDKYTDAIFHRFDTLVDTLLGEGRRKRKGRPSIPDQLLTLDLDAKQMRDLEEFKRGWEEKVAPSEDHD